MLKKILPVALITILALFLVILKVFPEYLSSAEDVMSSDKTKVTENKQSNNVNYGEHRSPFKNKTFPFNNKIEEENAKKHPDQFDIVKKMFYGWDYIDNAQGEFDIGDVRQKNIRRQTFYVDLEKKKNLVILEILENQKLMETENILLVNQVLIRQIKEKKIFSEIDLKNNSTMDKDEAQWREIDQLGVGNIQITESEWFALIYNNYTDWKYTTGTKFGIPTYEIQGNIQKWKSEYLEGRFTMSVSKDTGALLDLECYDTKNKLIYYIKINKIQINQGVDPDVFKLDVSGSKEISFKEYNVSGYGAGAAGEKTGWDQ